MLRSYFDINPRRAMACILIQVSKGDIVNAAASRVAAWANANLTWLSTRGPIPQIDAVPYRASVADLDQKGWCVFSFDPPPIVVPATGIRSPPRLEYFGTYSAAFAIARNEITAAFIPWESYGALQLSMANYGPAVQAGDLDAAMAAATFV